MLKLDAPTKSLELRLAAPVATTPCPWYVSWVEANQTSAQLTAFGAGDGTLSTATAVTVIPTPAAARTRKLDYLSVVNLDTAAVKVTVQVNVGGTARPVQTVTLAAGDNLSFTDAGGWRLLDAFGQEKAVLAALAHHATHELGGTDVVTLAQSQVTGLVPALAGKADGSEGPFTPTLLGSGGQSGQVYSSRVGTYVKAGRGVICQGEIVLATVGTFSGYLLLGGLPFSVSAVGGVFTPSYLANLATPITSLSAQFLSGTATAIFRPFMAAGGVGHSVLDQSNLAAGFTLQFGCSYVST